MSVDTKHNDYAQLLTKWGKCRAAADGEVKAEGTTYLPLLSGHKGYTDPNYISYLARAYYYNATGRTIDALHGMVYSKDPTVEWPESRQKIIDNVNLRGSDIIEFAGTTLRELLTVGSYGVLVDHNGTRETSSITQLQAERLNIRAKLVAYKAEDIINWRYATVNGAYQLTLVVLREWEQIEQGDGGFQTSNVEVFRVLRLSVPEDGVNAIYTQEVYKKTDKGVVEFYSKSMPQINSVPFDYIPFRRFPDETNIEEPPLLDLVETNLAHYRTSADYEHGVHHMGMVTIVLTGGKMKEGADFPLGGFFSIDSADAKVNFLEFQGEGLGAIEKNLTRKENQMASLGARLLQEANRQVETAEAVNTKQNGENSVLAAIAKSTAKGLTWCMDILAKWEGISEPVGIELNTDYIPDSVDAQTLNALLTALQAGKLSLPTFLYNVQRGGYMEEGRTLDDEQDDIQNEDLPPPAQAVV